jgi:hypothetical protein
MEIITVNTSMQIKRIVFIIAVLSVSASICTSSGELNGPPEIKFDHVPAYGTEEYLEGCVRLGDPVDISRYRVAVYISIPPYGWWNKPSLAQPLTTISENGYWVCDISTGGQDRYATEIAAFLVPYDYQPPQASGQQCFDSRLYQFPHVIAIRYKKLTFAGVDWWVKQHHDRVGPGPNYFSDAEENVRVDPNGLLHVRIDQRGEKWYCGEVVADAVFGYGMYVFTIEAGLDTLDRNVVLGLFTWEDCVPEHHYREIDIEISQWGNPDDPNNGQYVVQPWDVSGNMHRFEIDGAGSDITTHVFTWEPNEIRFQSYYGDYKPILDPNNLIATWSYTGTDIPPAGAENPRINCWLMNGNAPASGRAAEVVIRDFKYLPLE